MIDKKKVSRTRVFVQRSDYLERKRERERFPQKQITRKTKKG